MRFVINGAIGGFCGWAVGYFTVISRFQDQGALAQGIGAVMAPTAPDTMLFMVIGVIVGFVVAGIAEASAKKNDS